MLGDDLAAYLAGMRAADTRPPLWRCPACPLKTRDVQEAYAHRKERRSWFFGRHEMYHAGSLKSEPMTHADLCRMATTPTEPPADG